MKKKFDFSAEMNEAESIKDTPKNEYLEEENLNIKELASLNDKVHEMSINLENLFKFLQEYKLAIAQGTQEQADKFGRRSSSISFFIRSKTNVMKLNGKFARLTVIFQYHIQHSIS